MFKRFDHIPCFQTLPPSRAPQARGEACVTVFEQRSHLGPPAEGRPGPSDHNDDDNDDDYDDDDDDDDAQASFAWQKGVCSPPFKSLRLI